MAICLPSDVVPESNAVMAAWTRAARSPGSGAVMNVRLSSHGCVLVPVTTSYTGIAHVAAGTTVDVFSGALVATEAVDSDCAPARSFCAGAPAVDMDPWVRFCNM